MSRTGWNRRVALAGRPARLALPLLGLAIAAASGSSPSRALGQQQPPPPVPLTAPATAEAPAISPSAPGVVVATPAVPVLAPDVQVVRFQGPEGVRVEVLGPAPEPVTPGDGKGLATFGLRVGVGYKLRVSNLPERPDVELFPMVEILGHLHRPTGIDPSKYPIRVVFRMEDIEDAADHGRLVTQVVYLEDPDQALPVKLGKDEPPYLTLNPAEEPLEVARALGRVMATVRIGGRQPSSEELSGPSGIGMAYAPCPFMGPDRGPCKLPCGPVCGTPPPAGRAWMPRDEFLCDGGDHGESIHFAGEGGLLGIDPRDAVVQFTADDRPRVLPTNVVCVYAPRFASVRVTVGVNEALNASTALMNELIQRQELAAARQGTKRLTLAQAAELSRLRLKATGLQTRVFASEHSEVRVLGGFDNVTAINTGKMVQAPDRRTAVQVAGAIRERLKAEAIKSAESAVITGVVEGAGQMVMTWPPREVAGVEVPPRKPGLAVVKRVDAEEAEPGDTLTYTIQYRNMGNVPIRAVTVIDSLMPRLEYVAGSAQGPANTIFTYGENKAGALELRWDLPGAIAPGAEGAVTFRAVVR